MAQSIKKKYGLLSYVKMIFLRAKKIDMQKSYKYKNCFRIYKYINKLLIIVNTFLHQKNKTGITANITVIPIYI